MTEQQQLQKYADELKHANNILQKEIIRLQTKIMKLTLDKQAVEKELAEIKEFIIDKKVKKV